MPGHCRARHEDVGLDSKKMNKGKGHRGDPTSTPVVDSTQEIGSLITGIQQLIAVSR